MNKKGDFTTVMAIILSLVFIVIIYILIQGGLENVFG